MVMPAIDLATKLGIPKAANTMMLAALSKHGVTRLKRDNLLNALVGSFWKKPALAEKNRSLFTTAEAEIK